MFSKIELYRKMLNFILAVAVAGHVNSLAVHDQKLNSVEDVTHDISTNDDLVALAALADEMIDDEDYDNFGGSGDMYNAYEQDGDNAYEDNTDDKEYPDEYIDELAEDLIMAEEEDFVESLIKEYEDDQYGTDEDDQYVTDEDDQYVTVGREVLKQDGAGGLVNSNFMAGILAASASFFIIAVMAIFYVIFRVRRMKKELCEEAELYGFLDDPTYNTKVIWKGEGKNSSNRWL